jgi:hypothetical protein
MDRNWGHAIGRGGRGPFPPGLSCNCSASPFFPPTPTALHATPLALWEVGEVADAIVRGGLYVSPVMTVNAMYQILHLHAFARGNRRDNCRGASVTTVPNPVELGDRRRSGNRVGPRLDWKRQRYPLTANRAGTGPPEPHFRLNRVFPNLLWNRVPAQRRPTQGVIRITGVYGGGNSNIIF